MSKLNVQQARYNMIEQQIRPWEVLDQRVLDLLNATPRELFVPPDYTALAFADLQIPLPHGQCMMEPKMEGRVLQSLDIRPTDRILEIGTGSGYLTACLAQLGAEVVSVEIHPDLSETAAAKLHKLGIGNAQLRVGDAGRGWDQDGSFDVIAVTGSLPRMQPRFIEALEPGGRLFVVVGTDPVMEARVITRTSEYDSAGESLFDTKLPPLLNAEAPADFEF